MKKLLLLCVVLVFGMACLNAQNIADYSYSTATNGSLMDMSSGTTPLLPPDVYYDDNSSSVVDIGFNFTFCGLSYTQFSANSNGQMQLGSTVIYGFPGIGENLALLQPLSGDNAIMATGKLHYKVFGSQPNRILVVEWSGFRIPYADTGVASTIQVWLYETTNVVKYVYGAMYNNATYDIYRSVVISNSNVSGAVGNIVNITTAPTWDPVTASVVTTTFPLSSTMANLDSAANGARRVFIWTPPVANQPPNPALVVSPVNGVGNVMESATLNWVSGGGMPDGYYLYFGTNGGGVTTPTNIVNGTNMNAATTFDPNPNMAYGTTYYWQVVPYNTYGSATGNPIWSFTTRANPSITVPPTYTQNMESWPPLDWDLTGGTQTFSSYTDGASNHWARANYWSWSSGNTAYMTSPPIQSTVPLRLQFTWSHLYSSTYPNDALTVQISTNMSSWTNLLYLTGPVNFNSNDGAGNTLPGTGVQSVILIPGSYVGAPFYLRFFGYSGYGPDLFIDNIIIDAAPAGIPGIVTMNSPANGTLSLSPAGFNLAWTPSLAGGAPTYYEVFMSRDEDPVNNTEFYDDPTNTTYNPVTEGGLTFNYGERWYWTVAACNGTGCSDVPTPNWFEIQSENEVIIGTGNGIGFVPVYPYYTYTYSQSIYLQSEISRPNRQIEEINWYWNGATAISEPNIDIYMGHTALTDLTAGFVPISQLQLVYSGPYSVPATPGWINIVLTNSFLYNNSDNLVIAVHENGGPAVTYYHTYDGFYQTATTGSRSRYQYNDSAPYDLNAPPAGTAYNYVPNLLLTLGAPPTEPVYHITPGDWAFGSVEQLNPAVKQYTLSNHGIGQITIGVGDIYIDPASNPGGNFSVVTPGLPVTLGVGGTYTFNVIFTPQTLGAKTATLKIQDNLTRVLHSYALSGTGIAETVPGALVLQGTVVGGVDASLSWMQWNGPTSAPGWVYWGNGVQYDAIGTNGIANFDVAQKFPTSILSLYNGEQLTSVRFYPYVDGTIASYTIRLWTGTDADLAPNATPVYEQVVTTFTANAWNEVVLTTPYTINSANALYIGYNVNTTSGYPAGCDGGPQVAGLGNLIQWNGIWSELTALNSALTYNWCIQGYVSDVVLTAKTGIPQISIPVQNNPVNKEALRNNGFTSALGTVSQINRALQGYNVYRNNVLLNTAGYVTGSTYYDPAPGLGTFNYQVKAVFGTTDIMSNIVPLTFSVVAPYNLPFVEEWNTGTYADQEWGTSATNWIIDTSNGEPAPCASFSWSPTILNYAEYLTSHSLNGVGQTSVTLSFELALNNYSMEAENWMAVEVWNGTTWNTVNTWSSFDNAGAGWGWTYYSFDISAYAIGHEFKVRFAATGEDSFQINYWYIDNINVYAAPSALATPVVTITESDPDVLLMWQEVPGAIWYGIYTATDPYGAYTYLGWLSATYIGIYLTAGNYEFFSVTAGAGSLPRGRMLERGIQH